MRKGLTLSELAETLDYQQENKRDFIVSTEVMSVAPPTSNDPFLLEFADTSRRKSRKFAYPMSRHTLTQVAQHTKVPITLIDTMSSGTLREREAIANLMQVRLREHPAQRTVRTLTNRDTGISYARAFMSDRYRALDNYDLTQAILPIVAEFKGSLVVESADVTETKLYIKLRYPEMQYDISQKRKVNDIIEAGVIISNSEVGAGALNILPFLLRLICMNGATVNEHASRKAHVGRKQGDDLWDMNSAYELFTDQTKALDDAAFFAKVTDTVRGVLSNEKLFEKIVSTFAATQNIKIKGHVEAVVQEVAKKYTLNVDESQNVLKYLIKGGDLTQFGLINAVTRLAKDPKRKMSYDRASELESIGGKIIELGPSEWSVIGNAKRTKTKEVAPRRSI